MSTENELVSSISTAETSEVGIKTVSLQEVVRSRETVFLPASELSGYEKVLPGSAETLLSIMEKQALHRMELDIRLLKDNEQHRNSAMGVGIIVVCMIFILALVFGFLGMETAATASVGLPALYGIAQFIRSFNKHTKLP